MYNFIYIIYTKSYLYFYKFIDNNYYYLYIYINIYMRSFPLGLVESGTDLHIAHHSKVFWWVQPLSGAPQEMP